MLLSQAEKVRTKEALALDFYPGHAHHAPSPGLASLEPLQHFFFMAMPDAGFSLAPSCSRTIHCGHSSERSSRPWRGSHIERWERDDPTSEEEEVHPTDLASQSQAAPAPAAPSQMSSPQAQNTESLMGKE